MSTELIISLLGALTTITSGVMGWMFGKKRQNAEIASMQLDYIRKLDDYYVEKIESLMEQDKIREAELTRIKYVLKSLVNTLCIKKDCNIRIGFNPMEIDQILQGTIPIKDLENEVIH